MITVQVKVWDPEKQQALPPQPLDVAALAKVEDCVLNTREGFLPGCRIYTHDGLVVKILGSAAGLYVACEEAKKEAEAESKVVETETEIESNPDLHQDLNYE